MQAVLFVPAQFPTIQAAIDAVRGPATIILEPGLYPESVRVAGKESLVIQSARLSRRGATIGGDRGDVIGVEDSLLHLSGIEVRSNGRVRGLSVVHASVSLQECVIAGNRIDEGFGAAMFCDDSAVHIQLSAIVGNTIDCRADSPAGGGSLFFRGCKIEIAGSTVQANAVHAPGEARGGGIWCERSSMRMWRSRVTDNALHALRCEGAGIYFKEPLGCQLGGSVITGNGSPSGRGGGIFIEGDASRVVIHRNTVVRRNHPTDVEGG
jgi:hypothetical protein